MTLARSRGQQGLDWTEPTAVMADQAHSKGFEYAAVKLLQTPAPVPGARPRSPQRGGQFDFGTRQLP